MILQIKIEKEHFYFLVILVAVLFVVGVNAYTNPSTHVGHDANETGPGIFGGTASDWFTFPGNLRINKTLNMSGNMTFENRARITAPINILLNTSNVTIQGNLTLNGTSRDHWPEETDLNEVKCLAMGGSAVVNYVDTLEWGDCFNTAYYSCRYVPNCVEDQYNVFVLRVDYYDQCRWACKYTG